MKQTDDVMGKIAQSIIGNLAYVIHHTYQAKKITCGINYLTCIFIGKIAYRMMGQTALDCFTIGAYNDI
jgi:hypothetical protein